LAKQRAVIIGAGMAGLAAALRLAESGRFEPVLVEREERPGGLARSLQLGEFTTDFGPHRIHSEDPEILEFIKEVAAPSLLTVRRSSHMLLGGGLLRYPPDPLGLAARLGPLRLARFAASFALERLRPPARPETYESLMKRAFGPALYDFLLRPYSAKTWKIDPAKLHADTARVRISAGNLTRMLKGLFGAERRGEQTSLKEFLYVRGGAETLARHLWERAAAAGARLETGCAATALELDAAGRVTALRAERGGEAVRFEGDLFLSTAPLPALLGELLPAKDFLADARAAASGLSYLDNTLVCLALARPAVTADTWLYFPEPDIIFNRGYEARAFDAALAPAGRTLLTLEVTHRRGEAPGGLDDAALLKAVSAVLERTGLVREDEIERGDVHHVPFAYPLYTLDYDRRLERAVAGLRRVPNLITCGRQGLFNHNNMDHSIAMGLAAADAAARHGVDEGTRRWYDGLDRFKNLRIVD
jgi:protoporphyrinogen oxidase